MTMTVHDILMAAADEYHPLHEPELPTPETAEDFWTREVSL